MNFTPEMLNAVKNAKTAEELIALAKENNIEATEEEIKAYFEQTHTTGELADDELDNVAGGGCGGGGGSSGPKQYKWGRLTYTEGGNVICGRAVCGYFTNNLDCPSRNTCFHGRIYFTSDDTWYVECKTCGGTYHGSGNPVNQDLYPDI